MTFAEEPAAKEPPGRGSGRPPLSPYQAGV
jgi:hypothetical protein